ncbi:MAG: Ig-like domain-containing protein [Myxococcales bacterium]
MRRLATLLFLAFVCSCSEPPPPTKTCSNKTDCAAKQYCSSGVCIADDEGPTVTITAPGAAAVVTSTAIKLEGTASDNSGLDLASLEYSIDGGDYVQVPIGSTFSVDLVLPTVEQKDITVAVRATDAVGNQGSASVTFTLDLRAPSVVIASPMAASTLTSASTILAGSVTDVAGAGLTKLEYSVDDGEFQTLPVASTFSVEIPLPETDRKEMSVTVRATNTAGYVGSGSVAFAADRVGPTLTVPPASKALYVFSDLGASVDFKASASDGSGIGKLEWSFDDGTTWQEFATPDDPVVSHVVSELDDGVEYRFKVRATDQAGNATEKSADPVYIDAVLPTIQLDSPPVGTVVELGVDIPVAGNASDKHLKEITATVNGAPLALTIGAGGFAATLSPTEERDYRILVKATDESGNEATADATFSVDNKPILVIVSPSDNSVFNLASPEHFTVSVTVTDATPTTLTYQIDNEPSVTKQVTSGSLSFPVPLALEDETPHTIVLEATDAHLQKSQPATLHFTTDRVGPVISLSAPTEGKVFNLSAASPFKATGSVTDKHLASATWKLDGDAAQALTFAGDAFTFDLALSGADDNVTHTLVLEALDAAGNKTTLPARHYVVDKVSPKVAFVAPSQNYACGTTCGPLEAIARIDRPALHFAGTASDGGAVTLALDFGGAPVAPTGSATWQYDWTAPADNGKPYTVTIKATDGAGNTASAAREVWVDKVAPTMTMLQANKRRVPRTADLVSFSEQMDPATITATFTPAANLVAGGAANAFRAADGALTPYTLYKLEIAAGAKDRVGNPAAYGSEDFLTETVAPPANVAIHVPVSRPRMAVDSDGNPMIAYWDATAGMFYLSFWNGKAWTTTVLPPVSGSINNRGVFQIEVTGPAPSGIAALNRTVRVLYGHTAGTYGPVVKLISNSTLDESLWDGFTPINGSPVSPLPHLIGTPSFRSDAAYTKVSYTTTELKTYTERYSGKTFVDRTTDFTIGNAKTPHGVRGLGLAATGSLTPETDALAIYTPKGYPVSAFDASRGGVAITGAPLAGPAAWLAWSQVVLVYNPHLGYLQSHQLSLACSTNPESANPNWQKFSDTILSTSIDTVISAIDLALTASTVGIALESASSQSVAFATMPNDCYSPTSPTWDLGFYDAKEPTVAVGTDGKIWKAYVKASTNQLVIAE